MAKTAESLNEILIAGGKITKEDQKFLSSWLNINTRKAPNAGKTKPKPTGR